MVVITNFSPPTEGLRHVEANTVAVMNNKELGSGTLYVSESNLSWKNVDTDSGFSLEYIHIALHAVSRDLTAYPKECLYVMVDKKLEDDEEAAEDEESDEEGDSNSGMTEMRFIPENKNSLDSIFTAMNYCQSLHPDPVQSLSEDEGEEDEDEDEMGDEDDRHIGVAANGCANGLNGSDHTPMETDGQFEDAES
ncbi:unnamed protein product [Bemisia tabaci]|uniref:Methylosome subunit pICln n=1 Tax=Bemisia tabaci TaxID=7038 RepID=A0A9P0F327_BEMTA|nr:unnamed protein product [Bemisia tabaci]